jgi:Holliday junction resolvase RusA-like endonuclease
VNAPISYVVPGKPVSCNRNGSNATGRYGKTPEQKDFAARLACYGAQARARAKWGTTFEPVSVAIRLFFASRRPDADGPVKAILDSLEVSRPKLHRPGAGFLADDRQVRFYSVTPDVDPRNPRVEIEITP